MSPWLDPSHHAMWLAVLYATALRLTVVVVVIAVAAVALRRASAATRSLLWSLGALALLLLPLVRLLPTGWAASVLPGGVASLMIALGSVQLAVHAGHPSRDLAAAAGDGAAAAGTLWPSLLLLAWLGGVGWICLSLLRGWGEIRRRGREAERVDDPGWLALLDEAAARLGLRRRVRLLRDPAATTPLTWGTLRPVVVLPSAADHWPLAHRRAVLLHELAHVARHDCLLQVLSRLACALHWYHPGAWWIAARLRVEREQACDDRVLSTGTRPSDYAECLLRISDLVRGGPCVSHPVAVSVGMARPSRLKERLHAVLESGRDRGAPSQGRAAAGMAAALVVLVAIGSARLAPSVPVLLSALQHPQWETRAYAAGLLGAIGDPAAAPAVAELARSDPSAAVRRHASLALCTLGPAGASAPEAGSPRHAPDRCKPYQ